LNAPLGLKKKKPAEHKEAMGAADANFAMTTILQIGE